MYIKQCFSVIMCFWICFSLTIYPIYGSFFLAKKSEDKNTFCVTNSSSALSWIPKTSPINEIFAYGSEYKPSSLGHYKIENDTETHKYFVKNPWTLNTTVELNLRSLIVDERWEDFSIFKTEALGHSSWHKPLNFYNVLNLELNDFVIPISIRIENEGHIYLCDGKNVSQSNCYWFLLQAYGGNSSSLRKCKSDSISSLNNVYPLEPCKTLLKKTNHPEVSSFLSEKKWSHILLSKQNRTLSLTAVDTFQKTTILEYHDYQNIFNVTHMIFHSKLVNGLWKIHNLNVLYTTNESKDIVLGPPFPVNSTSLCISLYVSMCLQCSLKLSIAFNKTVISEKTYESEHSGWMQIKFITEFSDKKQDKVDLLVSTIGMDPNRFWAIDNLRICHKTEYRTLGLSESANCQLISNLSGEVIFVDSVSNSIEQNSCPEDTIGDFCLPCSPLFGDCKNIIICTDKCVCSAGYKGFKCARECATGKYGHGCANKCGLCRGDTCSPIDGKCLYESCKQNYSGPKCDIPPSWIFTYPPIVERVEYTKAKIKIPNFETTKTLELGLDKPDAFVVQYAKIDVPIKWIALKFPGVFNVNTSFEINNLDSETKYLVRSVIVNKGKWEVGTYLKTSEFVTPCLDITNNNIQIEASNISAKVKLKDISAISCKLYKFSLFEDGQSGYKNESGVFFENLEPFKLYTLLVQKNGSRVLKEVFKTDEGVPGPVIITITEQTSTSVGLKFSPQKINGELGGYVLKYQHLGFRGCYYKQANANVVKENTVFVTNFKIDGLIPYSNYTISIFVKNYKFDGPATNINISTLYSNDLLYDEVPKVVKTLPESFGAILELSKISCDKKQGPLEINATAICTNKWCENDNIIQGNYTSSRIKFEKLRPFCNYTVSLIFCRHHSTCHNATTSLTTEPSAPNKVSNLSVYTKNSNSISLRWDPPYPPTGILRNYKIIYTIVSFPKTSMTLYLNIKYCKIWPEMHCATLTNLDENYNYEIEFFAQNQNPKGLLSEPTLISAETLIGKSDKPYGVNLMWSEDNNLLLEWKHPNSTNGDVKYFKIVLTINYKNPITHKLYVSENNYTLIYHYRVKDLMPTTNYEVRILANNGVDGFTSDKIDILSPPDIPILSMDPIFYNSNETIIIKFLINERNGSSESLKVDLITQIVATTYEKTNSVINCSFATTNKSELILNIGSKNKLLMDCTETNNLPLKPATTYNISIILKNSFQNMERSKTYSYLYNTTGVRVEEETGSSLFGLLVLLFIIPIAVIIFLKRHTIWSYKNQLFQNDTISSEQQIPLSQATNSSPQIKPQKVKAPPQTLETKIHSKEVKLTEFEEYLKESLLNGELERQHAIFPRGQTKPWTCAALKENKSKNRYNNLLAYDHSRVILENLEGEPFSDYINANYINSYKLPKTYIATQGPKASTIIDFWRMIWQENVSFIVNLANVYEGGKKKLEKYWPEINETLHNGAFIVEYVSHSVFANYVHRIFSLSFQEEKRKIEQIHFSSWPDHGVPLYSQSLVPFIKRILQVPLSPKSPIVVHCSAGVGRTGTILLCEICLRMAAREGSIDIFHNLSLLRANRTNMVDNIEQYKLAHIVVFECLFGLKTGIRCNNIENEVERLIENDGVELQMKYLEHTQWQDQAMKSVGHLGTLSIIPEKNRFENIFPEIQGSILLSHYPSTDETSTYINAITVDGFRNPNQFVVTQQPLPNTIGDFWRLIDEKTASPSALIISLNKINLQDESSCHFWPTRKNPVMVPVPKITLQYIKATIGDDYDLITINLTSTSKNCEKVQILSVKNWAPGMQCPDMKSFLKFWQEYELVSRGTNPVFVTCYDGVTASGLFVAFSFILDKMKFEQICDVCQAVRNIRHNRIQFVQNVEQFEFLYETAVKYITGFSPYANFH